jgi:ABC-type bacteriocin/lantibiotic exporter with double-glycine peptidase domain
LVAQNTLLFSGAVAEHCLWPSFADMEDMPPRKRPVRMVLLELPDRYETLIGDQGIRLSGGQRQRCPRTYAAEGSAHPDRDEASVFDRR